MATSLGPPAPTPCDLAADERRRAPGLLAEGKLHRALRTIQAANERCAAQRSESWEHELDGLIAIGDLPGAEGVIKLIESSQPTAVQRDLVARSRERIGRARAAPPESGSQLAQAGFEALAAGRGVDAQRSFDRAIHAFEQRTGQQVALASAPAVRRPVALAWSADGSQFAEGSPAGFQVRQWPSRRVLMHVDGPAVSALAFSVDGARLFVGEAQRVLVYDASSGELDGELALPGRVQKLAVAPGHVAVATTQGVSTWDTSSLRQKWRASLPGTGHVLVFSHDGAAVAAVDGRHVTILDAITGRQRRRVAIPPGRMVLAVSPDHRWAAFSLELRGSISSATLPAADLALFDLRRGAVSHKLPDHPGGAIYAAFTSDSQSVIAVCGTGFATRWDIQGGPRARQPWWDVSVTGPGHTITLAPDDETLGVIGPWGRTLWDTKAGRALSGGAGPEVDDIRLIAASADGQIVAAMTNGSSLAILRTKSPHFTLLPLSIRGKDVSALAVSHTSNRVAIGKNSGALRLLDASTGQRVHRLARVDDTVDELVFSQDGTLLAAGPRKGPVFVSRVRDGTLVQEIATSNRGLMFSPDSATIAATRKLVQRWAIDTGQLVTAAIGSPAATHRWGAPLFDGSYVRVDDGGLVQRVRLDSREVLQTFPGMRLTDRAQVRLSPNRTTMVVGVRHDRYGVIPLDGSERKSFEYKPKGVEYLGAAHFVVAYSSSLEIRRAPDVDPTATVGFRKDRSGYVLCGGRASIHGDAAAAVACRIGHLLFPVELCRERFVEPQVLGSCLPASGE